MADNNQKPEDERFLAVNEATVPGHWARSQKHARGVAVCNASGAFRYSLTVNLHASAVRFASRYHGAA